MVRSKSLLMNRQGSLIQWLRLLISGLVFIKSCQVIETGNQVWMFWTKLPLIDLQCLLKKRFCLSILTLHTIDIGQASDAGGYYPVLWAQNSLAESQGLLIHLLCLSIFA